MKKHLYNFIDKAEHWVFENPMGKFVFELLNLFGIYDLIADFFKKRQSRVRMTSPTNEMIQSREFFARNEERVRQVTSFLQDDESVDVFTKMIDFRCNSNVDNFPKQNRKHQYFMQPFFTYNNSEVLIDAGAYTGDTISSFYKTLKHYNGNYNKIIAFEPNTKNYKQLMKKHKGIVGFNCGVWDKDTVLYFDCELFGAASRIATVNAQNKCNTRGGGGGEKVFVRAIDNCQECSDATFIKMDIEGAELQALIGAENTIVRNKPKLAICIYHSDEDMLRIAQWIHCKVPEYKLFVRQHNNYNGNETVLYAVI